MPDTFIGLALFVLFIAPGHIWVRMEERWRPRQERSGLSEAAELVTTGGIFSLLAGACVIWLGQGVDWSLSITEMLQRPSPRAYALAHVGAATVAALVLVLLSHLFALLAARLWFDKPGAWIRQRIGRAGRLRVGHTVWFDLFGSVDKQQERVPVTVGLNDGAIFDGFLLDYVPDAAVDDQVLALQGPIFASIGGAERIRTQAEFGLILGSNIRWVLGRVEPLPNSLTGTTEAGN